VVYSNKFLLLEVPTDKTLAHKELVLQELLSRLKKISNIINKVQHLVVYQICMVDSILLKTLK
jgi:hypothetical protein